VSVTGRLSFCYTGWRIHPLRANMVPLPSNDGKCAGRALGNERYAGGWRRCCHSFKFRPTYILRVGCSSSAGLIHAANILIHTLRPSIIRSAVASCGVINIMHVMVVRLSIHDRRSCLIYQTGEHAVLSYSRTGFHWSLGRQRKTSCLRNLD